MWVCVTDGQKERGSGPVGRSRVIWCAGAGRAGVSAARRPHTERNVSQCSHIHQGPTVLALGPVQLLTSEATSRDTRPGSRGPEGGVGMVVALVVLLVALVVAAASEARQGERVFEGEPGQLAQCDCVTFRSRFPHEV